MEKEFKNGTLVMFDREHIEGLNRNGIKISGDIIAFEVDSGFDEYPLLELFTVREFDGRLVDVTDSRGSEDRFFHKYLRKAKAADVAIYRKAKKAA